MWRIDPWSAGRVGGAFGALLGLLGGLVLLGAALLWGAVFAATLPLVVFGGPGALVAGLPLLIAAPLVGAIGGDVTGMVVAFLLNLALGFAGGPEVELETE